MLIRIFFLLLATLFMVYPADTYAEDDLRELIIQLTTQVKELKNQVAQSNERIDELEQKLKQTTEEKPVVVGNPVAQIQPTPSTSQPETEVKPAKPEKPAVVAGDIAGTMKIPGTDTSLGIGGFIKLDTLYSSVSMGKDKFGNQRLEASEIPVTASEPGDDDQISLHAKASRFWIKSFTPSQWGDMNTYLEIDFQGDAGAYTYTPRVRHAYGSLGNLLAGQTWTTFLNSLAIADTLDNANSVGSILLLRQPLLRWTQPFSVNELPMEWQLALEAPRTRAWDNNGMTTVSNSHYPDIVARLNFIPEWGNISLAAMGRQLKYTPAKLDEKSIWGGAVSLAGKISTIGPDNIRFMLSYGDGLGRYGVNNFFEDAVVNSDGSFDAVTSYSGMLAYQHWWDKAWRSSLVYGFARADQSGFASAANQQTQSLHANLLWSPITQTTIGLEYVYANRELVNGQDGELQRVQFSTRFNF